MIVATTIKMIARIVLSSILICGLIQQLPLTFLSDENFLVQAVGMEDSLLVVDDTNDCVLNNNEINETEKFKNMLEMNETLSSSSFSKNEENTSSLLLEEQEMRDGKKQGLNERQKGASFVKNPTNDGGDDDDDTGTKTVLSSPFRPNRFLRETTCQQYQDQTNNRDPLPSLSCNKYRIKTLSSNPPRCLQIWTTSNSSTKKQNKGLPKMVRRNKWLFSILQTPRHLV